MASSHRRPVEDEDVPPPPYSETDIYSTSGRGPNTPTSPLISTHHRRNSSNNDNDDIVSTTTTSNGEIIYTPPLTPRSSQSNSGHFPAFHSEGSTATEAAYAAYFEDRPVPAGLDARNAGTSKLVTVTVWEDTSPHEIAFPSNEGLEARDVTIVDWQTFTNFLLGNGWDARRNEEVLRRKDGGDGSSGSVKEGGGSNSPVVDLERVEERRAELEKTVREWNSGFFGPRGVNVVVRAHQHTKGDDRRPQGMMPGSWGNGCVECERVQREQQQEQQQQFQSQQVPPQNSSRGRGFGLFSNGSLNPFGGAGGSPGNGGFNFAGIKIDGDRVSIGDRFVADGRAGSLKIGGIDMDSSGIRINGSPMFGGHGSGRGRGGGAWCSPRGGMMGCPPGGMPGGAGWPFGGSSRGRRGCGERGETVHQHWGRGGRASWWGPTTWQSQPQPQSQPYSQGVQDADKREQKQEPESERGRGRRGRHSHRGSRHRSRSSSVSSVSSSSSSSSASSVGSLPDYDDLKDSQLPVAKKYLQESLHRSDQMITREKVKEAKQKIKEARKNSPSGINEAVNIAYDRAELRRQVKELMREWKQLKKEQKKQRRQLRKEKRNRRREEKRERRNTRRELRRAERDFHRGHQHHDRHHPHRHQSISGNMPSFAIPRVPVPDFNIPAPFPPAASPIPAMPPIPTPPGAWPSVSSPLVPVPSPISASKYKAADEISDQLAAKEAELLRLHESIALELENSLSEACWPSAEQEKEALRMEREIEELGLNLEKLRTEADEEFARELAMEEEKQQHGGPGVTVTTTRPQEEGFRALNMPGI
ncbi:hypothetical protein QBC38DRAFT_371125 [Podospora fimiseda]|uniref:Uncharacterized protein n=1 Tax=Podospora fimiseda TaxID=252190 RepID=A0AAN7BJG7_9PEZI|nr:hypothetical protein QBC38DRAFT_371125 [Podospora fimiseda]